MFNFSLINNDFTLQIISKLKPSHSSGHDSISINTLKIIMRQISPYITLIINQCFSSGIFLNKLKMARVLHIYKRTIKLFHTIIVQFPFFQQYQKFWKTLCIRNCLSILVLKIFGHHSNMDLCQIDPRKLPHWSSWIGTSLR